MVSGQNSAGQLCLSCGLCCRGLFHTHGVLNPEEVEGASTIGLKLVEGGQPAFALPCSKFDGCCTIYEDRPAACRGFRCALLRRLEDNEIALEDALDIVSEARRLADEAMPEGTAEERAGRFRAHLRIAGNDSRSDGEMSDVDRLRFTALALYLDRHFVLARDGQFYSVEPIASSNS